MLHSLGVVWTVVARCSMRLRHWRRVGSRAAADEDRKPVDRERLLLLFPSLPAVRDTTTCNNRKRTTQSILVLFFLDPIPLGLSRFVAQEFIPVAHLVVGHRRRWWRLDLGLDLLHWFESEEDRLLKGFAEDGLLAVRFCRLLKLGERLEEGCLLLPLCSGRRWRSVEGWARWRCWGDRVCGRGRVRKSCCWSWVGREREERWLAEREEEGISVEAVKGDGCFVLMNGGEVADYGRWPAVWEKEGKGELRWLGLWGERKSLAGQEKKMGNRLKRKTKNVGGGSSWKKDGFRVRFFVFFMMLSKLPPL